MCILKTIGISIVKSSNFVNNFNIIMYANWLKFGMAIPPRVKFSHKLRNVCWKHNKKHTHSTSYFSTTSYSKHCSVYLWKCATPKLNFPRPGMFRKLHAKFGFAYEFRLERSLGKYSSRAHACVRVLRHFPSKAQRLERTSSISLAFPFSCKFSLDSQKPHIPMRLKLEAACKASSHRLTCKASGLLYCIVCVCVHVHSIIRDPL